MDHHGSMKGSISMATQWTDQAPTADNDCTNPDPESPIQALSPSLEAFISGLGASRSPSPVAISLDAEDTSFNYLQTPQRGGLLEFDTLDSQRTPILTQTLAEEKPPPSRTQKHPATFQCTLCPKRFTRAYNLRSHLRTHTDERPFVCSVCGKAFARQHDRKRHERMHSGEKSFICRGRLESGGNWGCGRRFVSEDALQRHMRSEDGMRCLALQMAEDGEVGDIESSPKLGELSKKDAARYMSYTISEDYTNKDRVRKKRLCAFKGFYSRKRWKKAAQSRYADSTETPISIPSHEENNSFTTDRSFRSLLPEPPPLPSLSSTSSPLIANPRESVGLRGRKIGDQFLAMRRLSNVFDVLRRESEKVEGLDTTPAISTHTRSLVLGPKGLETGGITHENDTKTGIAGQLGTGGLYNFSWPSQDSNPEAPIRRPDSQNEPILPTTHSLDVMIYDALGRNDEDNREPPRYLSELVGRTSNSLPPAALGLGLDRRKAAEKVALTSITSRGVVPHTLSKRDRAPVASYGLHSPAF